MPITNHHRDLHLCFQCKESSSTWITSLHGHSLIWSNGENDSISQWVVHSNIHIISKWSGTQKLQTHTHTHTQSLEIRDKKLPKFLFKKERKQFYLNHERGNVLPCRYHHGLGSQETWISPPVTLGTTWSLFLYSVKVGLIFPELPSLWKDLQDDRREEEYETNKKRTKWS